MMKGMTMGEMTVTMVEEHTSELHRPVAFDVKAAAKLGLDHC